MITIPRLAFFAILLIGFSLAVAPLFIGPAPPMTDFCQHALVAHMMNHYEDSQLNYQAYFTRDHSYRTMYLAQLLLSLLERIGGAILGARLFLVLFVALLYLGTYAFARSRKVRGPEWIALGSLPLAFSWPVYSGLLPFVMTFPLFSLLLAWWTSRSPSVVRTVVAALVLLVMHAVHLVGAVAGAMGIMIWSAVLTLRRKQSPGDLGLDLLAVVPLAAVVLVLFASEPPSGGLHWSTPFTTVKSFLGYTCGSLAEPVLYVNLAGITGLGCCLLFLLRRGQLDGSLAIVAATLAAAGLVAPMRIGALWPAGPRLFPFAILTAMGLLDLDRRSRILFVAGAMTVLACDSITTINKVQGLEGPYRQFLAGQDLVPFGSKLLPILVDPHSGSRLVDPFWSLASLYTINRGGSHPYVFARPYTGHNGFPLQYRDYSAFPYAFLYKPDVRPEDYRGVSSAYGVILLWGQSPALSRVLGEEMDVFFKQGDLQLYRPRRPRTEDRVHGNAAAASSHADVAPGS